ncbi:MAG: hypothetical protein MK132_04500 [Lentisphaerales bacterium]|nr:hypothetical protein [Lentisphaerales bacterium]
MNDSKLCSTISKRLALCALLSIPYLGTAQAQQDTGEIADQVIGKDGSLSKVEVAIKQQKELEGDNLKLVAEKAYRMGDLSGALENFKKAIATYKKVSASEERVLLKIEDSSKKLSEVYKQFAKQLTDEADKNLSVQKFDQAIETLEQALKFNPELDQFVAEQKRRVVELRKEAERVAAINAKGLEIEHQKLEEEKGWRLEQAQILYSGRRFIDAKDMLEEILVLDPFDSKAATLLLRVNEKLLLSGRSRRIATVQERVDEVEWKWNLPIKSATVGLTTELSEDGRIPASTGFDKITEKLKIIIPRFRQNGKIQEVIDALKEESIKQDVDKKGVTLIYRPFVESAAPAAAAVEDDGFDAFAAEEDDPFADPEDDIAEAAPMNAVGNTDKKFNFDFENMPINEIIRYICLAAGLKFKVDDHAVIIADPRVQIDEMVIRFYPVNSQVFAAIKDNAADGGGGADLVGGIEDVAGEDEGNVKQYLEAMGVQFPAGANVAYLANVSRLVVTNTITEQRRVQEIINQLQVEAAQIVIETKFVEINQADLEEFGFQWALQETGTVDERVNLIPNLEGNLLLDNGNYGRTEIGVDGNIVEVDDAAFASGGLGSGIRSIGAFAEELTMNGIGLVTGEAEEGFLSFTSVIGSNQFNTIVRALSQQTNADVLSAPKVITQNGNTAILRVVTERYFPESWEAAEITLVGGGNGQGQIGLPEITPSAPNFGDPTDLGVVLEVTPQVDPDGVSIEIELKPQVIEFVALDSTFNTPIQILGAVGGADITALSRYDMPILSSRSIDTRIKMWDGESVVIGGLLKEKVVAWKDNVPYLSDVPLIGELFKNEGDGRVKQNLLIFVTARLVNNAGLPIRENNIRGLPDFKRL